MDIEERLIGIDSKLDLLIQREDYRDEEVHVLRETVFGAQGDNGLRLRVRLLEEAHNQKRWALKIVVGSVIAATAMALLAR